MLKAYKYRIYPNNEQKVQIEKTFGCCVLCIIRHLHIGKKDTKKRKNLSAKQIVIITATGN